MSGWYAMAIAGLALLLWAYASLPKGTSMQPGPIQTRTTRGPYRYAAHPLYIGNILLIVGCGGAAAGWFNAVAFFVLAELVMAEWAGREVSP